MLPKPIMSNCELHPKNKLQWNLKKMQKISFMLMHFQMVSAKYWTSGPHFAGFRCLLYHSTSQHCNSWIDIVLFFISENVTKQKNFFFLFVFGLTLVLFWWWFKSLVILKNLGHTNFANRFISLNFISHVLQKRTGCNLQHILRFTHVIVLCCVGYVSVHSILPVSLGALG